MKKLEETIGTIEEGKGMKRVQETLATMQEINVHTTAGKDILAKQEELTDALETWSEEMSQEGRKAVDAALKGIEKLMAPIYKDLES